MLRTRFVECFPYTFITGLPDLSRRGETVGWVEDGPDGAKAKGMADGPAQDDGAYELLKGRKGGGGICAELIAPVLDVLDLILGAAQIERGW